MARGSGPRSGGALLLRRAAGMLGGYYVHRWVALWLGVFEGSPPTSPAALAGALLPLAVAALVAGYVATFVAGGSTRTARLLGIALAAVAILAALQRLEQHLPLLARQVAQIATSPLCAVGGMLLERHRAMWTRAWAQRA